MGHGAELLPGTLDLLILKAASLGPLHGYGILLRIEQISGDALNIEQGALYPALARLERQQLLDAKWGVSDNNRRAKYYRLTASGRRRLRQETDGWQRLVDAILPEPLGDHDRPDIRGIGQDVGNGPVLDWVGLGVAEGGIGQLERGGY